MVFRAQTPHQLKILESGLSALKARLELIRSAEKTIEVEYFIFNNDAAGKFIANALVEAARRGVKVRVLVDYFLVGRSITAFMAQELFERGIEIKYYNTAPLIQVSKVQYRNHRKSLIVDDKKVILGGRNIGDEYFDLSHEYNFVDRDALVEGEIVLKVRETFDMIWKSPLTVNLRRPKRPEWSDLKYRRASRTQRQKLWFQFQDDVNRWDQDLAQAKKFITHDEADLTLLSEVNAVASEHLDSQITGVCPSVTFATDRPWEKPQTLAETRHLKHEIFKRMKAVEQELVIDSPYFVLSEETTPVLDHILLNQKAKITLLTNGLYSTDAIYVASVFNSRIPEWIEKGMSTHVYSGDIEKNYAVVQDEISKSRWGTHSKSFVFDDRDFFIGSYNIDPRSNVYSLEMGLFCDGNPEFASRVRSLIQQRIDNAIHLKSAKDVKEYEFSRIGPLKRLGYYLTAIPAALFDHLL
ncbi:MAG: phospholipase D family protein [Bdellovibrio sp.]